MNIPLKTKLVLISVILFYSLQNLQAQYSLGCTESLQLGTLSSDNIIIPQTQSITVEMLGGDGGRVRFEGLICDYQVRGGAGASAKVTFKVGVTAEDNIAPIARCPSSVVADTKNENLNDPGLLSLSDTPWQSFLQKQKSIWCRLAENCTIWQ